MAKLADMLSAETLDKCIAGAAWMHIAQIMGAPIFRAKLYVSQHGLGMIYTRHAFCMPDTKRNRKLMARRFGAHVILQSDGTVLLYEQERTREIRAKARAKRERAEREREMRVEARVCEEWREKRSREQLFADGCRSTAGKKRQGRANSHDDFGKYVNRPSRQYREPNGSVMLIINDPNRPKKSAETAK